MAPVGPDPEFYLGNPGLTATGHSWRSEVGFFSQALRETAQGGCRQDPVLPSSKGGGGGSCLKAHPWWEQLWEGTAVAKAAPGGLTSFWLVKLLR